MSRSPSPLWQLTLARIRESVREPMAIFWVYGFPLILAVVLGVAFRERPMERINVDVIADEGSADLLMMLEGDPRLTVEVRPRGEALRRLQRGRADLVVGRDGDGYVYWTEPNRPESVLARNAVDSSLLRASLADDAPAVTERSVEAPGSRYIDFLIPGLVAMNLMGGGLWGVGFQIVDQRIRKLLKRFLAAPMRRSDFLLSLILSRMLFMVPEVLLLLAFGRLIFGVGVAGNFGLLVGVIVLGGACFAGVGILVACRAENAETVSGINTLVMLSQFVFSGIFFSSERFPEAIQPVVQALPLTALADALRAVMLDGAGVVEIGPRLLTLAVWTASTFGLGLALFRWR